MIEKRLGAGIPSLSRENDNLIIGGNAHSEPILYCRAETLAARSRADLAFEAYALTFQLNLSCIEGSERFRLLDADRSSPNDREGDEQETREEQSDNVAAAHVRQLGARREAVRSSSAN
jgi:hypothetical protein